MNRKMREKTAMVPKLPKQERHKSTPKPQPKRALTVDDEAAGLARALQDTKGLENRANLECTHNPGSDENEAWKVMQEAPGFYSVLTYMDEKSKLGARGYEAAIVGNVRIRSCPLEDELAMLAPQARRNAARRKSLLAHMQHPTLEKLAEASGFAAITSYLASHLTLKRGKDCFLLRKYWKGGDTLRMANRLIICHGLYSHKEGEVLLRHQGVCLGGSWSQLFEVALARSTPRARRAGQSRARRIQAAVGRETCGHVQQQGVVAHDLQPGQLNSHGVRRRRPKHTPLPALPPPSMTLALAQNSTRRRAQSQIAKGTLREQLSYQAQISSPEGKLHQLARAHAISLFGPLSSPVEEPSRVQRQCKGMRTDGHSTLF